MPEYILRLPNILGVKIPPEIAIYVLQPPHRDNNLLAAAVFGRIYGGAEVSKRQLRIKKNMKHKKQVLQELRRREAFRYSCHLIEKRHYNYNYALKGW